MPATPQPLKAAFCLVVTLTPVVAAVDVHAMEPFIDGSEALANPALSSGAPMAVADMNGDGLDDIVRLDVLRFLEIEHQRSEGSFALMDLGDIGLAAWSVAVGDVDANGFNDIFVGGNNTEQLVYFSNDDGSDFGITVLNGPRVYVQCSSFADINNDGSLDLFVCNDIGKSLVYENDGAGNLALSYATLDPVATASDVSNASEPDAHSGNYGNVWSDFDSDGDFDLYISKCRQGVTDPNDDRRLNSLFRNNGDGTFTEAAEAVGLLPRGQSWAADFSDIDNDGDLDAFILNHESTESDPPSELYANNGDGTFAPITAAAGIQIDLAAVGLGIQAYFGDFDNDTFVDLLVSTGTGTHQLLFNNGEGTFTADNSVFSAIGSLTIQSFAVGDLNDDGWLDILAGFGFGFNTPSSVPDRLLLNPAQGDRNWLKVHLQGTQSNRSAVGARIEIFGAWGQQTREIRAGEGYGITHSLTEHFGLGPATTVDSLTVTWPGGAVTTIENPGINRTLNIIEGCPLHYADNDGDGFGDSRQPDSTCFVPEGRVLDSSDCDDADENNFPLNPEVCDQRDNDCDGVADEGLDSCTGATTGAPPSNPGAVPGHTTQTHTSSPIDDSTSSAAGEGGCGGCAARVPHRGTAILVLLLLAGGAPARRRRQS